MPKPGRTDGPVETRSEPGEPRLELGALDGVAAELDRAPVGRGRVGRVAGAPQQLGPGGVEGLVGGERRLA